MAYILNDHDEERKFDAECLIRLAWASDEVSRHVSAHDFKNA